MIFRSEIVLTVLIFRTEIVLTALIVLTEIVRTALIFLSEIVLTVLTFLTEIVLTVLTFLTEIVLTVLIFITEVVLTVLTFLTEIVLTIPGTGAAEQVEQDRCSQRDGYRGRLPGSDEAAAWRRPPGQQQQLQVGVLQCPYGLIMFCTEPSLRTECLVLKCP